MLYEGDRSPKGKGSELGEQSDNSLRIARRCIDGGWYGNDKIGLAASKNGRFPLIMGPPILYVAAIHQLGGIRNPGEVVDRVISSLIECLS